MVQLFQYRRFFVNLINFVCLLEEVTNVDRLYCDDLFSFFVLGTVYLAESTLPNHLIHLVLIYDLSHVEATPIRFEIQEVTILQEVNIVLSNL